MKLRRLVLSACFLLCLSAQAANYCVATDGDDRNAGTSPEQPFATIQHAVDVMQPGDTCYIRAGVYRETINLSGKAGYAGQPITLTNYKNEPVTLDGTLRIGSAWTLDEGKVYKTTLAQDVTQLFVDGALMTLARFPNALAFSDTVWHRTAARCFRTRESSNGHVIDGSVDERSIAGAGFSFNDCVALLNFGAHATASRLVENHVAGSAEFDYSPELKKYKTTLNYFFEGGVGNAERVMLDHAQEWAYDETSKTLYLWADDGQNPSDREIYGKVQSYAIVGDATTQHIVIDGLDFFATTFSFTKSDHITIQNCDFSYYAASKRALGILGPSETAHFTGTEDDFCTDILVYNCSFQYADASALLGEFVEDMRIVNNLFHQIDYACVNNDWGPQAPFSPSSSIRINKARGLFYRRNTLSMTGNAQGFSANRYIAGPSRKFRPEGYDPASIENIVCEYNFHTACGLLHTDGSSLYMPDDHVMESVIRYNWFIGNGQRDFRWDGNNRPLLGVHGNLYRNVAMDTGVKRMSPSGGNGFRVKGSYHEVYHNLGVGRGAELNIATEKGGNDATVTRNNAASHLTDQPIPGIRSHNYAARKEERRIQEMLRDLPNWDFRPKADAVGLIDQGTPVRCSIRGESVDVSGRYNGAAPDIGAYEYGDEFYWIPGRQEVIASMPVPKDAAEQVPLDADLMYLIGLHGTRANIYWGSRPDALKLISSLDAYRNIVSFTGEDRLQAGREYYWRVDTVTSDGSVVPGTVWMFSTINSE
ncbi:hypothetical protein SH580_18125 [Coraliomargarita algicola]|uniref:DUF1565 domain-containing protein n=1 Tax=Coraliomargarita algicola TaxID=3092156 RepID=A0ABZ0RIW6_9BACT|nr:hypothetical protein [Coraliomargarita sp. J2-16]WPJ95341.1 hypothetical protein SH580_18125 [Coraliomargarita sp. J2-16]